MPGEIRETIVVTILASLAGGRAGSYARVRLRQTMIVATASSMTAATSRGCESNDMWLDRITVVLAFIRLASDVCSSALTTRSSDVTRNQQGFVFQAATVMVCPNAFAASRPWVTAKVRASSGGRSSAMFF